MKLRHRHMQQQGVTLVELLIAMTITLFLVIAAAYVYLGTRETQRSIDEASVTDEAGNFVLDLISREVLNAGTYPVAMPPVSAENRGQYDTYPPKNWTTQPAFAGVNPYAAGIFGCEGAVFNPVTGACGTTVPGAPDSIVVNYFTSDGLGPSVGQRRDCLGSDVRDGLGNGIGAAGRAGVDNLAETAAPRLPLFVSNRYSVVTDQTEVNQDVLQGTGGNERVISTGSLQCQGSGNNNARPQPLVLGIRDLQFTYGVYNQTTSRLPDRFYTATEVNNLGDLMIENFTFTPWARVVAVRICVLAESLGGRPRLAEKENTSRKYQDCNDATQDMQDGRLLKRYVKVLGARNQLNQTF